MALLLRRLLLRRLFLRELLRLALPFCFFALLLDKPGEPFLRCLPFRLRLLPRLLRPLLRLLPRLRLLRPLPRLLRPLLLLLRPLLRLLPRLLDLRPLPRLRVFPRLRLLRPLLRLLVLRPLPPPRLRPLLLRLLLRRFGFPRLLGLLLFEIPTELGFFAFRDVSFERPKGLGTAASAGISDGLTSMFVDDCGTSFFAAASVDAPTTFGGAWGGAFRRSTGAPAAPSGGASGRLVRLCEAFVRETFVSAWVVAAGGPFGTDRCGGGFAGANSGTAAAN